MNRVAVKTQLAALAGIVAFGISSPSFAQNQAIVQAVKQVIPGISEDLVNQACKEGKLDLFQIAVTPSVTAVNAAFKKLLPCVEMNVVQAAGGQLAQRFEAGQKNGDVPDYYEQSDPGLLEKAAKAGQLLNYEPTVAKSIVSPSPGLWYPEYGIAMGLAYNTDKISDATAAQFKTWADVAAASFANAHFAIVSPAAGGTALTAFYDMLKTKGDLKGIKPKNAQVFDTSRPAGEALSSGESDLSFPFAATTALQILDTGAPVHIVFPTPVDVIYVGGSISKQAKHPAAAKLFLEFMLSPTGQQIFSSQNGAVPANSSVKFTNKVTSQPWWKFPAEIYKYDPSDVTAQTGAIMSAFKSAFGG
jgi:iron(III) transport system substrate-binding protein